VVFVTAGPGSPSGIEKIMKSLTLTVNVLDTEEADVEELLCGFGKLLTQGNKISDYVIHHVVTERRPKRGPYSIEDK
jgi:hypothetical protein